jgi:hypothetical protein
MVKTDKRSGTRLTLLVAGVASLGGACGNVVDLEVQAQSICVAAPDQTIAGVPAGMPAKNPIPMNFSAPLKQLPGTGGLEMDVRFRDLTLKSTSGDLSFVDRIVVELTPSSKKPGLATLALAGYTSDPTRSAASPQKHPLVLKAADIRNVYDYVADEPAKLQFTMYATWPSGPMTLEIEGCVDATARFRR